MQHVFSTRPADEAAAIAQVLASWQVGTKHGNWRKWEKRREQLPSPKSPSWEIIDGVVHLSTDEFSEREGRTIEQLLRQFMPWRKGPYQIGQTFIDTEWRSDFKWDRLLPHITSLKDRDVLDIGCGSGYHLWRMLEAGAKRVVGIDPTDLFFMQHLIVSQYAPTVPVHFLPLALEQLPASDAYDTVFSMGVFYHRRDPFSFLKQCQRQLKVGGELILETLVVPGDSQTVLMPQDRYAQMSNVWFLPSVDAMLLWLTKAGFKQPHCIDVAMTTTSEQRRTDWIEGHSLADFLDPVDASLTVEGYPAPTRAVFIAQR
jgi:tRNA (mo5U34)-methyltransferase